MGEPGSGRSKTSIRDLTSQTSMQLALKTQVTQTMNEVKKKVAVINPEKALKPDATNPPDKVIYNDLVWRGEEYL